MELITFQPQIFKQKLQFSIIHFKLQQPFEYFIFKMLNYATFPLDDLKDSDLTMLLCFNINGTVLETYQPK